MGHVTISPNTFLKRKVTIGTGGYLVFIKKENSPVKTALSFFSCRFGANFDEMKELAYKTNSMVLNDP